MSHAYVCNLMHCTFSTKDRHPWITADLEVRLWPYIGGIARENRMKALAIGGVQDHLHALLSLPGMMSFAKALISTTRNSTIGNKASRKNSCSCSTNTGFRTIDDTYSFSSAVRFTDSSFINDKTQH